MHVAVVVLGDYAKEYDFLSMDILERGDRVVCDTINGLVLGRVVQMIPSSTKATRWVVCKIDMEAHKARVEKAREIQAIKTAMEQRRREVLCLHDYGRIAEYDPQMANLLKKYEGLVGSQPIITVQLPQEASARRK